jgi:hypothetical protein
MSARQMAKKEQEALKEEERRSVLAACSEVWLQSLFEKVENVCEADDKGG